jgi:hypothetical protein
MKNSPELLDVIALIEDLPEEGLQTGQVGTVVEVLDEETYEVEFVDKEGTTYAQCPVPETKLMRLQYEPAA